MKQHLDSMAPADCREKTYELLAQRSPSRVLVDIDLPRGTWYVVRAPYDHERAQLQAEAAKGGS